MEAKIEGASQPDGSGERHRRLRVLFIGAFPPKPSEVFGGQLRACQVLMTSSLVLEFDVRTLDTTQKTAIPSGLFKRSMFGCARFLGMLREMILHHPEVVCVFISPHMGGLAEKGLLMRIARLFGSAVVALPRGELGILRDPTRRVAIFARRTLSIADVIVCQTPAAQSDIVSTLGRSFIETPVIANWTATPDLLEWRRKSRDLQHSRCLRFVCSGWIEESKGTFDVLEAFRILCSNDQLSGSTMTFIGGGRSERQLRDSIRELEMEEIAFVSGWVPHHRAAELLRSSDVLIHASHSEGFPNAIVEAMALGKPVISSDIPSVRSLLESKSGQCIVPVSSPGSIAEAMKALIADPPLCRQMGEDARAFAATHFSVHVGARALGQAIRNANAARTVKADRKVRESLISTSNDGE